MSVSILRGNRLWGLLSCHHARPRQVSFAVRAACDLIGQMLAARIAAEEEAAQAEERERLKLVKDRLFARVAAARGTLPEGMAGSDTPADLCVLTGAAGAAVLTREGCVLVGRTPPEAGIRRLADWLQQRGVEEVFVTHALGAEMPDAEALAEAASGVLAAPVSRTHPSFVFWFRPEVVLTVRWGGDPHKPAELAEAGPEPRRLSPRHSFEAWKEMVRGTSTPWSAAEVEAARELRQRIIEAALRRSEARLRELQAELLHVSRLSAAGEMAAALAHELHQPLTAVASAVQAAQSILASSSAARRIRAAMQEALDLAAEQSLRAGQIVRRLRAFVAKGEAEMRPEDLRRLVEEAAGLALVGTKDSGVAVSFRFHPALPPVLADRVQIQQVLVNLIRNAMEAMAEAEESGTRRRELVVAAAAPGSDSIEVSVADTGPGLPDDVAGRIFEPFVTTKREGMGVGLSICQSIVAEHGGSLEAAPRPGGGTVFRAVLPALRRDLPDGATDAS
jgi:light-regulated signal transduction histidine kinase (bacteriophytochrome)